jgi:hypothetical protein
MKTSIPFVTNRHERRSLRSATVAFCISLAGVLGAKAQHLDGTLDTNFYGSPLYVQTINTGFGNSSGGGDASGCELDAVYTKVSGGNLYIFIAGCYQNNGNHLNVFIAGGGAGQTNLNISGGWTASAMNGSGFPNGFQATYMLDLNDYSGTLYANGYVLNNSGSVNSYLGSVGLSSGIGTGTVSGIEFALNNTLTSTMGASGQALSGAGSGTNTTTGLEIVIPTSAIGYTSGAVNVLCDINGNNDGYLSNQFLPGLAVGSANLGTTTFNFSTTPPVTNQVVFAVDMTYQIQLGYFHPGSSVYVAGNFNGWPGASSGNGLLLVNNPPYNSGGNTNIYYGTNTFIGLPGTSPTQYKFNQNDASAQNGGWESIDNKVLTLLTTNGTLVLPIAVFNNLYASEVLQTQTLLTFTVDMTGAVDRFGNPFDPNNDLVLVDGDFLNPQWACLSHPADPVPNTDYSQNFLTREGTTMLYTNSYTVPAGNTLEVTYKYGIYHDSGNLNTNVDNEAGYAQNHSRYIRNNSGVYNFATDIFGQQRTNSAAANEIAFGNLTIGRPTGSVFPIAWLGLPGVHLQYSTGLGSGWTDLNATDGTMSTNWPSSTGSAFFRLIRPLQ